MTNLKKFDVQVGPSTVEIYAEDLDDLLAKLADKRAGEWIADDQRNILIRKDAIDIIYTSDTCYL